MTAKKTPKPKSKPPYNLAVYVETYSTKPLFGRRQHRARIVERRSGKTLWVTSEGYNNRSDLDNAIARLDLPLLVIDTV